MIALVAGLSFAGTGYTAEREIPSNVPIVSPDELEDYQFEWSEEPVNINELSVAQRAVLNAQRRQIKDLFATQLGILQFDGDKRDLRHIQRLVDKDILSDDILQWQKVGVIFGDILVEEFDLEWVSYEDERGKSKALQWRDTMNFVFPITLFSRRVEYGRKINAKEIYNKVAEDIKGFSEAIRPPGGNR
ncbi:MAG: DUF3806 domain-containing protein [Pseudomonadales bacterium]